jgi:hypothetical protein
VEHIVLLGDSIFDNKSYVGNSPDVVSHIRRIIPKDWTATLCAVDGSITESVLAQRGRIPQDATQLVLSVGGNDALRNQDLLYGDMQGNKVLSILADVAEEFEVNYRNAVQVFKSLGKPLCICTIYNGNLPAEVSRAAEAAVAVFNDRIYSVADELGLPVIELRRVCTSAIDYANPIEPSEAGGGKIARRILEHVQARILSTNRRTERKAP